jgi:hypothetical protein
LGRVSHRTLGAGAVNWRSTRSSCTGGPALRLRPRFFAKTDQIRYWEHAGRPGSPGGGAAFAQLAGDEPVAECGVVAVNVVGGVDQVRVVPVEVGLDHHQVRRYDAWYRHITLACLAHAS